ncbi:U-box domain-containing protein 38-like [Mercurialis annua]|uniref:U-box domain-containing protein 38-like n=1 Tax=Mercurialis annua TaxID=3986 RepID=UPI002160AF62|nr:U-box domain-containing protein 38-like [Mercurialis annua]
MGGNGKHRWKISFYHRSNSNPKQHHQTTDPPKEFLCPISGSLMSDPVIVSSGQTFERVSVQVCRDLGFTPAVDGGGDSNSLPDFTNIIANMAIKTTIQNWCDTSGVERPRPPDYISIEKAVRKKMAESKNSHSTPDFRVSERELLKGVADNPPVRFSHAVTELTHRVGHFYSSSSEESVIVSHAPASPFTPLPFATRPACYTTTTSTSSSEITEAEILTLGPGQGQGQGQDRNSVSSSDGGSSIPQEEEIVVKLTSGEVHRQEEGVVMLRKLTRAKEEMRIPLATPRLLAALRTLIASRYGIVQTNAIASLVNLSLEKSNKVKLVRSGFVPLLIDVLKSGCNEPQEHAAGALFSLALEDENKMAIGVLGALQPLMHALRSDSDRTRHDSALALYHLSLIQSNRVKLVKLGAVGSLLSMVKSGDLASRLLLILCNLAACNEGRSAMLDGNAVTILVEMLREKSQKVDSEATRENCVAALFALSHGSLRFKGLAKEARAVEVLREIEERGSDRAREKAKKILQMMRGRDEEDEDCDWEGILESGGLSRTRYRVGPGAGKNGPNSSNF